MDAIFRTITIDAGLGDDVFRLDYINGLPVPAGGYEFSGGVGVDRVESNATTDCSNDLISANAIFLLRAPLGERDQNIAGSLDSSLVLVRDDNYSLAAVKYLNVAKAISK